MKVPGEIISKVLNTVYPSLCLACREQTARHHPLLLCERCLKKISPPGGYMCPRCGATMYREPDDDGPCPRCCNNHLNFARAVSAGEYEGPLGPVVRALKFGRMRFLASPLARELAGVVEAVGISEKVDIVTAVPLHWTRTLIRGFNQSALIAKSVAKRLRLKYARTLRRIRRTAQQTKLSAAARRRNPLNAFAAVGADSVRGGNVLLVDDVMTTGGTMMECARILRRAGAKKIYVAVAAR